MRWLANYDIATKQLKLLLDSPADRDATPTPGAVPFVWCDAKDLQNALGSLGDPALDSSAHLWLPALDVDSEEVYELRVLFLIGPPPVVVVATKEDVPNDLLALVMEQVAGDLRSREPDRWTNLASGLEWMLVRVLRRRIRSIEQSVRNALSDDVVSAGDYSALREYPALLARVERLSSQTSDPTCKSHRRGAIFVPNMARATVNPAQEARDAGAGLSGLIASQQIVLTQRQSAETERFQRVVTRVGAAVLVPGLVAAVFNANVGFAGRGTTRAFWAVVLLMLGSGLASYTLLRIHELGVWSRISRLPALRALTRIRPAARVAVVGLVSTVVLLLGVRELLASGSQHQPKYGPPREQQHHPRSSKSASWHGSGSEREAAERDSVAV
ncbi:MAG: hypothetical protein ACLP01_05380 [Solirubrobacteraceae bacterium]